MKSIVRGQQEAMQEGGRLVPTAMWGQGHLIYPPGYSRQYQTQMKGGWRADQDLQLGMLWRLRQMVEQDRPNVKLLTLPDFVERIDDKVKEIYVVLMSPHTHTCICIEWPNGPEVEQ